MTADPDALWRLSAVDLAARIRARTVSAREAVDAVLARIDAVNPRINALVMVLADQARAAADAADRALAAGEAVGPLHGVPITIKVNVDMAGCATTNGVVAFRDVIAAEDAPLVAHLRRAGAIIVGRTNTPAFSVRWFTDNDLHGRTLNPWDAGVTPGGSSGGAAAAVATGMGAIAHGNDYGGSIRYPAWACGVVGLRPTVGRVPSFNPTARAERTITHSLMSVQGPLARTVADAGLALQVMAQPDARDPQFVPAPLRPEGEPGPMRVALCRAVPGVATDPSVTAALDRAAQALAEAGWTVEEAAPPHFEEATGLWRQLLADDARRGLKAMIEQHGDAAVRQAFAAHLAPCEDWNRDRFLAGLERRLAIARAWSLFHARHPVLLMPVSGARQFPIDEDVQGGDRVEAVFAAQSPLLATAMLGVPGLSVPVGVSDGLPTGVQLVADRYREDRLLAAGAVIERAVGFPGLSGDARPSPWR